MIDPQLRVVTGEDVGERVEGKHVEDRGYDDLDVGRTCEVQDVQRVNIRVGLVINERRLNSHLYHIIVSS